MTENTSNGTTSEEIMTKRKHLVTFLSPGSFVSEQTVRTIASWDCAAAVKMAATIKERHGAMPYGFYFTTDIVSNDVEDGEGGTMKVQPKEVARSPMHYLGGEVLTYEQLCERGDPKDEILLSNMRINDIALVLQNCNSYKHTTEFKKDELVVDRTTGEIVDRGDAPCWQDYRREFAEIQKVAEL